MPTPTGPETAPMDSPLLQANEALVLSVLRTQDEIEETQRASNARETAADMRLEAQRLSEENRQLVETNRLKTQFIAMMSHELRTPLNAILGFSDLLRNPEFPSTAKSRQYLEFIHTSGEHLLAIITATLDMARGAAGRLDLRPEPVELETVLQEVVEMLQAPAERKQLRMQVKVQPGIELLLLDRTRLKQMVANYVSNAIKFSHPGGTVTVQAAPAPDHGFRVDVLDTGIGIAAADQPKLFREFHQLDSGHARKHEGSGLGLALTRMLVCAQGGSVGVQSSPGQGSCFHFVLPCAPVIAEAPAAAPGDAVLL